MYSSSPRYPNYVIYVLNFIIGASGIVLIVFGALYTINENNGVRAFLDFSFGPLAMAVGAIIFLVCLGGCGAAYGDKNCLLTIFASIMVAFFVFQMAFGVLAIVKSEGGDILTRVKQSMRDLFEKDDGESIQSFHDIEIEFQCCGVTKYDDYNMAADGYPSSCCDGVSPCLEPFTVGCATAFTDSIKEYILIIGAISVAISALELLAAVFTFMRIRYRDDYDVGSGLCCCSY